MKKIYLFVVFCLSILQLYGFSIDNLKKNQKVPLTKPVPARDLEPYFQTSHLPLSGTLISTDPLKLQRAARDTLTYIQSRNEIKHRHINPPSFQSFMSTQDVKQTLEFIVKTIEEDKETGKFRITNPKFVQKHFDCLAWTADNMGAEKHKIKLPNDGKIRLTSYAVLTVKGSKQKSAQFPCGLYQLLNSSIRTKYTKQQILAGALEQPENKPKRKAIAWVCRQDLEDAIMHGTVTVKYTDGTSTLLNVHLHNNIPYDRNQKNVLAQKRYWFFRELKSQTKTTQQIIQRIASRKNVIFAGNLDHIGIGKVIAIKYQNPVTGKQAMSFGVLADTGGAFINNLYQLDLFAGVFDSNLQLRKNRATLPSFVHAYVIKKKDI